MYIKSILAVIELKRNFNQQFILKLLKKLLTEMPTQQTINAFLTLVKGALGYDKIFVRDCDCFDHPYSNWPLVTDVGRLKLIARNNICIILSYSIGSIASNSPEYFHINTELEKINMFYDANSRKVEKKADADFGGKRDAYNAAQLATYAGAANRLMKRHDYRLPVVFVQKLTNPVTVLFEKQFAYMSVDGFIHMKTYTLAYLMQEDPSTVIAAFGKHGLSINDNIVARNNFMRLAGLD